MQPAPLCMPPPARVCKACKVSKVRCTFSSGEPCARCTRLGLICEEAPTKIPKNMALFALARASTQAENITAIEPAVAMTVVRDCDLSDSSGGQGFIWREVSATESAEAELFCLQHMAAIARHRNAHTLFMECARTCEKRGLRLSDVFKFDSSPDDDSVSPHPFEILQMVGASRGYCMARTVMPSGSNHFYSNAAFEHDVCSLEALNRAYDQNTGPVWQVFIHPEDREAIMPLVAQLFRRAACESDKVMHGALESPVRVRRAHLDQGYLECKLQAAFMRKQAGLSSGAFEFLPMGVALLPPMRLPFAALSEPAEPADVEVVDAPPLMEPGLALMTPVIESIEPVELPRESEDDVLSVDFDMLTAGDLIGLCDAFAPLPAPASL